MKKYYLLIVPVVIIILVAYYFPSQVPESETKITSESLKENGSPVVGKTNSKITILEWGDYQCTYCYRFHQNSKDIILDEYVKTGKANFIFRDFPLNGPDSVLAAQGSYCAGDQGKYWEFHDELYRNWAGERTGWINRESLTKFANTVGLDKGNFNQCLDKKKYEQKVLDNEKFGESVGIKATPSFLIISNDKIVKIEGNQPVQVFRKILDSF